MLLRLSVNISEVFFAVFGVFQLGGTMQLRSEQVRNCISKNQSLTTMFSFTLRCYENQLMCRLSTVDHNSSVVVFRIYAEKLLLQRNRHDFMSDM